MTILVRVFITLVLGPVMMMMITMTMRTMMTTMRTTMIILVRVCVTLVGSEEANCVLQISTFSAELEMIIMIISADDNR